MLEQLRGRNLAHVGCTIGLTMGLVVGLFMALAIISFVRVASTIDIATLACFAITFLLGGLGYLLGDRLSRRLWHSDRA